MGQLSYEKLRGGRGGGEGGRGGGEGGRGGGEPLDADATIVISADGVRYLCMQVSHSLLRGMRLQRRSRVR